MLLSAVIIQTLGVSCWYFSAAKDVYQLLDAWGITDPTLRKTCRWIAMQPGGLLPWLITDLPQDLGDISHRVPLGHKVSNLTLHIRRLPRQRIQLRTAACQPCIGNDFAHIRHNAGITGHRARI
ncbi:hypothetical protein [Acetobacter cerevisiae]|uniref:hypothetical protein n=1 Tax=Acetobacter cerevisiae TaxID=178900 RepID=UPI00357154B8